MATPTITDLPLPPHRQSQGTDQNLYRTTSNIWRDAIYTFVNTQLSTALDWMNYVLSSNETKRVEVAENTALTESYRDTTKTYRDETEEFKNLTQSVVIPTEATYTYAEIDTKDEEVKRKISLLRFNALGGNLNLN